MGTNKKTQNKRIATKDVLGPRTLNRALLARQMLLSRVNMSAMEIIERLVGLQAQNPNAPYFGLWNRLEGFSPKEMSQLIQDRKVVRISLMRSTLHLVSAQDCLDLRPWVQSVHERSLNGAYGKHLVDLDTKALATAGRRLVEDMPLTFNELGKKLNEQWPDHTPVALAAAVRTFVPLVQLPPRGLWGKSGQAIHTSAEAWLNQPLSTQLKTENIISRYLAAFGPATTKDIQVWSGLTRMSEAIENLRPQLVTFRNEQGYELFDLPDSPRPNKKTYSPPRFLGEFDNVLLSYANRERIIEEKYRKRVITKNGIVRSTILIDGFVSGIWKIRVKSGIATLSIEPFKQLSEQELNALTEEGTRLLNFAVEKDVYRDIVFVPVES